MERSHDSDAVHWYHEPRAVLRRTESADKSDALQTLRALRRRPAVAKRLECVRLQRRFPKAGGDSIARQVHGKRLIDSQRPVVFGTSRLDFRRNFKLEGRWGVRQSRIPTRMVSSRASGFRPTAMPSPASSARERF